MIEKQIHFNVFSKQFIKKSVNEFVWAYLHIRPVPRWHIVSYVVGSWPPPCVHTGPPVLAHCPWNIGAHHSLGNLGEELVEWAVVKDIWTCFLSLAWSKLRLCSANHRAGYFSNLACDWLSIVWAYSKQETENGPWSICLELHSGEWHRTSLIIKWNLNDETEKVLPKAHKFHHFPGSIHTKSCLFSLLWKTTFLETPCNSMITLYMFHCITKHWLR